MSRVEIGFSEVCEAWQVKSPHFPSKIGGKPAWLDYSNLPKPEDLICGNCKQQTIFLAQVYAPFGKSAANFHRTLFIFICKNPECCARNSNGNLLVFRSNLPRKNGVYSFDSPEEKEIDFETGVKLCELCGCLGEKICGKCKATYYCTREHQVMHWKSSHKTTCTKTDDSKENPYLFKEFEIVIEYEEFYMQVVNEGEELEKFKQLEIEGKTGTLSEVSEQELDQHTAVAKDKVFAQFRKKIADNPDQVLRYERGGQPLWIASDPKPESVPNCEYCGGSRQFEFQVMPQILTVLGENELDFGVLAVYTCKDSCSNTNGYKKEFVFKQDVKECDF